MLHIKYLPSERCFFSTHFNFLGNFKGLKLKPLLEKPLYKRPRLVMSSTSLQVRCVSYCHHFFHKNRAGNADYLNPIQHAGTKKTPIFYIFPCNFSKRYNMSLKFLDL